MRPLPWILYVWFCAVILTVTVVMILCSGCTARDVSPHGPRQGMVDDVDENPNHVSVLAFMSSKCGPCKRAKPFLLSIKADGVNVQIVDVDEYPNIAKRYGVESVPTFLVYVGGDHPVRTKDIWVVLLIVEGRR